MSWGDIDKGPLGQGGGGRFLQIPDDGVVTVRPLDEQPYTTWSHRVSQKVNDKDVYRTIPATENLDENYVQNNSNRYPATPSFSIRVIQIEDGEPVGEIMILQGGKQIFKKLREVYERHGTITRFDFDISKTGKGRDTEYSVMLAAEHADLSEDMDGLLEELEEDEKIQWKNVYTTPTPEQQKKMFEEAGFDINYDPAEDLADEMEVDTALATRMPTKGGKYPGKTMQELAVIDMGYLTWVAGNYMSDDVVAAAARVVTRHIEDGGKIAGGNRAKAQISPPAGRKASRRAKEAPEDPEGDEDGVGPFGDTDEDEKPARRASARRPASTSSTSGRQALVKEINDLMLENPKYEDTSEVAKLIKEHSGGKTRIRDMDESQLQAMKDALAGGGTTTKAAKPKARARRKK